MTLPGTTSNGHPPLAIGSVALANRVVLAPMSGVSDAPFRTLARAWGAGLTVTEMVASRELARARRDVVRRAQLGAKGERLDGQPHVVQLAGCEAEWMAEGARIAQDLGADVIDINMGCPAREVTGRLSGSALMRDPEHALALIEATVKAARVPVTLKMRLGWDDASRNAPELARAAEQAGVRLITVHGRTRCQFFKGRADWAFIRRVKDAVGVPVVANGDVATPADALAILAASGADGVMIGRGAYGAPWLLGQVAAVLAGKSDPGAPDLATQCAAAQRHYQAMLDHYGADLGARNARKHLGWYVEAAVAGRFNSGPSAEQFVRTWRRRLCTEPTHARVPMLLADFYDALADASADDPAGATPRREQAA